MNKFFKNKLHLVILPTLTVLLVSGAVLHSAWSYFTTYAGAKGGYTIHLGDETTVEEEFSDWTKHVSISNSADSQPVYVRVRAYVGQKYAAGLTYSGAHWNPDADGWYYYSEPVAAGAATEELLVHIGNIPADDTDSFNVVVVYESTPVLYHEDGSAYADWTAVVDTGTTEGGR